MSERDIILIGGKPGSGKSNLCRQLQNSLRIPEHDPLYSVEHISFGEYARQQLVLGQGGVASAFRTSVVDHLRGPDVHKPLDNLVAKGMVDELLHSSSSDIILLDGYPRYTEQVDHIFELATRSNMSIKGAIITHVYDDEAIRRITKRKDERSISEKEAYLRLYRHNQSFPDVEKELAKRIPIKHIDTYNTKEQTLSEAYSFVSALTNTGLDSQEAS